MTETSVEYHKHTASLLHCQRVKTECLIVVVNTLKMIGQQTNAGNVLSVTRLLVQRQIGEGT